MNRLTNNRVFIGILLMVLQLAFLPNVRRCSGTQLLGDSCCCTVDAHGVSDGAQHDDTNASQQDCCSKHASQSAGDESDPLASTNSAGTPGNKTCSCSHARAHAAFTSEKSNRNDLLKKHVSALLPTAARCNQSCHAIDVRVRCKPIPRARTGPPLQLLYQVFLI